MISLKKILLIEDEPDIREITKTALELVGGYQVDCAINGPDGLIKSKSYAPDLILLDVMMPGMDGPTTYAHLKEDNATASIPIIFMTAKVQQHEVDYFLGLGALGVIPKPYDPMQISNQIAEIWGKSYG